MKKSVSLLIILFLATAFSSASAADFYKYKDEEGLVHLTNDLSSVPEKFRGTVKIIREDSLAQENQSQSMSKDKLFKDAREAVEIARVEAEKFWWRWIVDPKSGATKAPVIIGGYLVAAIGTLVFIRRNMSGSLYKVTLKALLLGFAAIIILTYSAHRGHNAYKKFKASPFNEMASDVLKKRK